MGALAETPRDDTGTGEDAPDEPAQAVNLSPGSYVGNLTPSAAGNVEDYDTYENNNITKDRDWYRVNGSDDSDTLACTSAYYEPADEPHNETRIHLRQPALNARLNATTTSQGETLAMVGPSPSGALAGLTHIDPPRFTQYDLEFDVTTIDEVGGAGSADEVPGPCFGQGLADTEVEQWTFEAQEGDLLFLSLGTQTDRLDELALLAPNGTEVGSLVSGDDIALGAKVLDAAGNWTLSLEAGDTGLLTTSSSVDLIGFSLIDDPEEERKGGCDPHCMS